MEPLISVIMGVYNCKDFVLLKKSVQSIINQTYQNWEYIICNDGSTNETLKELHELELLDKRIRVISYNTNKGLNYALNKCLEVAKGKYIARQDDDDISLSTRFEKEVDFLNKHSEFDFVGTIADVFDNKGIWGEYIVEEYPEKKSFLWNSPFMHPTIIIRSEAIIRANGYRISKETRRCEDYDLFMRLYALGYKGYNIQEKLYNYKIENSSKKKHRPMKYRIDEAIVRFKGFKSLGILIRGIPYITKPILVGLIPNNFLAIIKKKQY